jgi:nucleoside-diphosphate-sugar epimerase
VSLASKKAARAGGSRAGSDTSETPAPTGPTAPSLRGSIVVVTGASGFVGRHLVARLANEGARVRSLVRPGSPIPAESEAHVLRDLSDVEALARAMRGADAVVHRAARTHVLRETHRDPAAEFHRVNVEGTRAVMDAAVSGGAPKVVLVSSIFAAAAEGDQRNPAGLTPYGASKLAAEQVAHGIAGERGVMLAVLRPPVVYGPGMRGNQLRLFDLVARGLPLPLGAVRNRRSVLFVENLVHAIECALAMPVARERAYEVSDGQDLSTPEFVRLIGEALDVRVRLVRIPLTLLAAVARAGDVLGPIVPFRTEELRRLRGSLVLDHSPLTRDAGYAPPHSVREGLARTAAWYLTERGRRNPEKSSTPRASGR